MPWKIHLVPIGEMVEAITTAPPQKSVKKGQWVRMKGGLFKGDIALVRFLHVLVSGRFVSYFLFEVYFPCISFFAPASLRTEYGIDKSLEAVR